MPVLPPITRPAAFGHWQVQGRRLACQLPRKTVHVQAPAPLLRRVLALCDGQLEWDAVTADLARQWARRDVEGFLAHLSEEGALVDATQLLPRWMDLGQAPGLHPPQDPPDAWPALERAADEALAEGHGPDPLPAAAAPVATLLQQRRSQRTYGDEPLDATALRTILWAAGGVTGARTEGAGWRRTTASGGNMHGLAWFVIVLRALPDRAASAPLPPGLYEARFHRLGGCSLDLRHAGDDLAWRVLQDPRVLRFASAMVLPVARVDRAARKYGNRAAIYAHIEAGQGLQNAQLMATALQAAGCVRGDASADAVRELLAPSTGTPATQCLPMPAYVVGSLPTELQERQQRSESWVQLTHAERLPGAPASYLAGPVCAGGVMTSTLGRAEDPALAVTKAEAEAWERLGWLQLSPARRGSARDIPRPLDPTQLVAYSARQYARTGFPFRPFDPDRRILWCPAVDVLDGTTWHVPADCVHAPTALPASLRKTLHTNTSTSGVAAWTDPATAHERATLELVERDAFVRAWAARQPVARTAQDTLPAPLRLRVQALQSMDYRADVMRLPSPWATVYAVFVQDASQPYTGLTAAAHFDPGAALAKALDEAEGRASDARSFRPERITRASELQTPRDHHHYFQMPNRFRAADFLAQSPQDQAFGPEPGACTGWQSLLERVRSLGLPLLAVDITPAGASIEQGRRPLRVVRSLLPGLLPIWFGHGVEPAGLPSWRQAAGAWADRPALPHPFS